MSKPVSVATKLQQKLKKNRVLLSKVWAEHYAITEQLQGICDHVEVEDWKWDASNGFGNRYSHVGKKCKFCGWQDRWNTGVFSKPYYEQDDRD